MFGASFGIISQALEIYRKSLDIRNRNVINANNPDYVEENPVIESFAPAGINLADVLRDQNMYYVNLRNSKLSMVRYLEERSGVLSNVEGIFQELFEGTGINDYTNRFYRAYLDLMKDPTNEGARSELYNSARSLSDFIRNRGRDLDELKNSLDFTIRQAVSRANELIRKIYVINRDITVTYAQTYARGKDYKNLLDTRDRYLRELSELINIDVQEDEIGRVKVITSKGFALVDFQDNYWQLEYSGGRLFWKSKSGSDVDITEVIESGKLKALFDAMVDLDRFKSELDTIAKDLISNVRLPRANSGTWYLMENQPDTTSYIGSSGTLYFYDSSNNLLGRIDYSSGNLSVYDSANNLLATYPEASLQNFRDAINTHFGASFSADIVSNPNGTYTLRITELSPNSRIDDTGGNFYESSPVFQGTGVSDIAPVNTLSSDVEDLDFSLTDTFSDFANSWWDESRRRINDLVNDISTTQADTKDKLRIESALLESLDRKLQEMQGVSIDKEFMEIMKIQRTYQAVARIVRTIDELLQTTLNM